MTSKDSTPRERFLCKKRNARDRDLAFNLPFKTWERLVNAEKCAYTGVPFTDTMRPTLERVDNTKGYVIGNVVPVAEVVNGIKADALSTEDMDAIILHMKKKTQGIYVDSIPKQKDAASHIERLTRKLNRLHPTDKYMRDKTKAEIHSYNCFLNRNYDEELAIIAARIALAEVIKKRVFVDKVVNPTQYYTKWELFYGFIRRWI